jgi:hypothetical protein
MKLRKSFSFWSVIVIVMMSPTLGSAQCKCSGVVQDNYHDPNVSPDWLFSTYLKVTGQSGRPPQICYFRDVTNTLPLSIVHVNWRIASYYRKIIPSSKDSPACVDIWDEASQNTLIGRLIWAVGQYTDTEVRPPKSGWPQRRGQIEPETLQSEFTLYADESSWAQVFIISSVFSYDEKSAKYSYTIKNEGNISISVLAKFQFRFWRI